jgi:Copper binding proteins, plastocyanin/azurin family
VLGTGSTFDHTFLTPGTFHYFCSVHQGAMTGTVTVNPPTSVVVRSLAAVRTPGGVVVRWRTGTDTRIAAFHLYRTVDGPLRRLDTRPIAARGGSSGSPYSFLDRRAPYGRATYWLQIVRIDGSRAWQGPVSARS